MHKKAIAKNLLVGQYCGNCAGYSQAHYKPDPYGICALTWHETDFYDGCSHWIAVSEEMKAALEKSFSGQLMTLNKVIAKMKICVKNELLPIFRWKRRRKKK